MGQYKLITGGVFDDETAVESSRGSDIHMLQSCQEEEKTRIILHAKAAHREEYERLIISCSDTDVLVLLIYFSGQLCQVWMRAAPDSNADTLRSTIFLYLHALKYLGISCTYRVRYCKSDEWSW